MLVVANCLALSPLLMSNVRACRCALRKLSDLADTPRVSDGHVCRAVARCIAVYDHVVR